jgi:hypothetical protein
MVCYLYSAALLYRVVVEVDIGAFVEAMVRGLVGWWGEIVMNVCKAAQASVHVFLDWGKLTVSSKTLHPAVEALCWCEWLVRLPRYLTP